MFWVVRRKMQFDLLRGMYGWMHARMVARFSRRGGADGEGEGASATEVAGPHAGLAAPPPPTKVVGEFELRTQKAVTRFVAASIATATQRVDNEQ